MQIVMEDVAEKITSLSMDDYIKEEQDEWMRNIDIADARKAGLKEGLEEGINQNKIETAKKMKEENIPLDTIVKITSLAKEEIEKL